MGLIAAAIAVLCGVPYGLLAGGLELLLIGATTDDEAVLALGWRLARWARRVLRRQVERERALATSPHPPLAVDPELEELSRRLAARRWLRGDGRVREAMPGPDAP